MNGAKDRLEMMFKGRLAITICAAVFAAIGALLINPSMLLWVMFLFLFECGLNQPYLWTRKGRGT